MMEVAFLALMDICLNKGMYMKKLVCLLIIGLLFGCATYKDFLYSFAISGVVECHDCNSKVAKLSLVDVNLDSVRSKDHYIFYQADIALNEYFIVNRDYLWGTDKKSMDDQKVMIIIDAPHCESFHKVFDLAELAKQQGEFKLDAGVVTLTCSN